MKTETTESNYPSTVGYAGGRNDRACWRSTSGRTGRLATRTSRPTPPGPDNVAAAMSMNSEEMSRSRGTGVLGDVSITGRLRRVAPLP